MNLNSYQNKAFKTATYPKDFAFEYLGLQIASEAGEVAGKIGKIVRKKRVCGLVLRPGPLADNEVREAIKYELGDVLWYVAVMAKEMNISLEEIAESNLEKLASRAERGVLHGDGDNR